MNSAVSIMFSIYYFGTNDHSIYSYQSRALISVSQPIMLHFCCTHTWRRLRFRRSHLADWCHNFDSLKKRYFCVCNLEETGHGALSFQSPLTNTHKILNRTYCCFYMFNLLKLSCFVSCKSSICYKSITRYSSVSRKPPHIDPGVQQHIRKT